MSFTLPTTLDDFTSWLIVATRQAPPPAFTTEAGAWRVYPGQETLRNPQEPWRVVIPALPPDADTPDHGQFHLPPATALEYAAILFYLAPAGEAQVEVQPVCLQPALSAYYEGLLAQIARTWPGSLPDVPTAAPVPPPPVAPRPRRARRLFADAAAARPAVTAVLRAFRATTEDAGAPPGVAQVAACFGCGEATLARGLARYGITWDELLQEAGWPVA